MAQEGNATNTATISPNLGLYLDRAPIALHQRMLQDGFNFRIKEGKLSNLNLGWNRFESGITLNGPVKLIDRFFIRGQAEKVIFGTNTDLYIYNGGAHTVRYITPVYATGTAASSGTAVTGVGTLWVANVANGDQIRFGSATANNPADTWYTITNVGGNTSLTISPTSGVVIAGAYTIRKVFGGDLQDVWVTDTFVNASPSSEDVWFATNGVDNVVAWNGTDTFATELASLGFTCKTLRVYNNMMIYGNLTQGGTVKPTDIINSDVANPADVSSGLSEQFKVHSGVDEIKQMVPIGDSLAIYSEQTVTVAQFVGDPLVFVFRNVISGIGAVSPRAVADFGDFHEFVGNDSQYTFDGASAKESSKQVFRDVLRQQDPVRINSTFNLFDEENGELLWVVPSTIDPGSGTGTSAPSRAYTEHYLEEVSQAPHPFSVRSFPFTAAGFYSRQDGITWDQLTEEWTQYNFRWNDQFFFAAFPLILVGDTSGKLYTLNTGQDADGGVALPSYVTFGRRAIVDGRMRALVTRVYPFVTQFNTPLDVTLHLSDHAMGPATTSATESYDQSLPEGRFFAVLYRRGRYAECEFGTDGPSQPWELSGFDYDIRAGGRR